MHKRKKKRIILPLVHGSVNVLLLIVSALQAFSGWQVYDAFVLGN
jgi:membrane protein CcdC involved in cytochrome C biogenesis